MKKLLILLISFMFTQELEVEGDLKVEGSVIFSDNSQQSSAASLLPAGIFLPYAGIEAPDGFLLCYGQEINREEYSNLFNAIGVQYGDGDGVETFNLPDMRGRTPLGADNMGGMSADRVENEAANILGGNAGEETHQLTINEMPSHTHDLKEYAGNSGISGASLGTQSGQYSYSLSSSKILSAGGDQPHNNMPPYLTVNYIIKY